MVIHSDDGLDEISVTAPTSVVEVDGTSIHERRIDPAALGCSSATLTQVTADGLDHAAALLRGIIDGTQQGAARDMTLLNAAATLIVADVAPSMEIGMQKAAEAIDSGAASKTLDGLVNSSQGA
jgi:anthranilate phosphoribosyltransferase